MSCSLRETLLSIVFIVACIILISITFYVLYKFTFHIKAEKVSKLGKILTITLHILTICSLILLPLNESTCLFGYNESDPINNATQTLIFSSIKSAFLLFYGMQNWIVLIIFFDRVRLVFNKTPLRLSKITVNIWLCLFVVPPFYVSTLIILFTANIASQSLWLISMAIAYLLVIIYMIALVILFINKLIIVYQSYHSKDENLLLLSSITKIVNLTSFSVVMTAISLIAYQFKKSKENDENYKLYDWISAYILICDIFTNYMCIVLCFKSFKIYYSKLCKHMDTICRCCWIRILPKADDTLAMMGIIVDLKQDAKSLSSKSTPNSEGTSNSEPPCGTIRVNSNSMV